MITIDLNCDLGEGFGDWKMGLDEEIMPLVTSVNIATGWHAGDPMLMDKTVVRAGEFGLGIGAHPGFPDLMGFGRRNMTISPKEAEAYILYQVGALYAFTKSRGLAISHVKPHGALYNMAAKDLALAEGIASALSKLDGDLVFMGLANSQMEVAAAKLGVPFAREVFADRRYQADGSLVPRSMAGAVIESEEEALEQVLDMVCRSRVKTAEGQWMEVKADTICVHGDNRHALAFVKAIRNRLETEGVKLSGLSTIIGGKPWR